MTIENKKNGKKYIKEKNTEEMNLNNPYQNSNQTDQVLYEHATLNGKGDGDRPTPPTLPPPGANESSADLKNSFKVYSHNVNGLRDESKLEYIPRLMNEKKIDAYLIQETHLPGDFEKTISKNYYIIHHAPPPPPGQPTNGAKGRVAIILSPELAAQCPMEE